MTSNMISFGKLIKTILELYSKNFGKLFGGVVFLLVWNGLTGLIPKPPVVPPYAAILVFVVSFCVSAYTELTLVKIFSQLVQNESFALMGAIRAALARLPKFLLLLLLWGILIIAGAIAFIIPAIIFGVWFMFLSCTYLLENLDIHAAFKRSKELSRGYFFPLLFRMGLIVLITMFVVSAASQGFFVLADIVVSDSMLPLMRTISSMINIALGTLLLPIITGAVVILYYEARRLKNA